MTNGVVSYPNTEKEPVKMSRIDNLLPAGIPKWIRCYDNGGKTCDRYTVVFTKKKNESIHNGKVIASEFMYLGMSEYPYDPQGFGQHGSSDTQIDRPSYSHIGKRIKYTDLPADCQKLVLSDYRDIWTL